VGLNIDDPVWDATVFTKNRERLLAGQVEFCVPPADLKTRIISIHLMSPEEQHEASRSMQYEAIRSL